VPGIRPSLVFTDKGTRHIRSREVGKWDSGLRLELPLYA
jgi:hypothetical protein